MINKKQEFLKSLSHPFIAPIIDSAVSKTKIFLVYLISNEIEHPQKEGMKNDFTEMILLSDYSIQASVGLVSSLTEKRVLGILAQLCFATHYLHGHFIIHGDIS